VALDVESGGESSGGSTAENSAPGGADAPLGSGELETPWWLERTPYNPWPTITGSMGW
jgi:hypothetical protein